MVEFASEPQRTFNPIRLYIIGGIIVLLVALFFILNHYTLVKARQIQEQTQSLFPACFVLEIQILNITKPE